jgi:hypothetical protein
LAAERSTTELLVQSRSAGVSKEIIATVRSASETILNREALEEDDELETDLEAFAELEEDTVSLAKGGGNLESHSKQEFHHQEVPGDAEFDETDLRSRLEDACVEEEHGDRFLPTAELDKLLTEQAIRRTMLASNPDSLILAEVLSATRPGVPPSQSLRRVFAVLTLLDRVGDISHFLSTGIRDSSLPVSENQLKQIWPEDDLRAPTEFENMQWQVLAPVFEAGSGDSPKVYHYSLDDRAILPFYSHGDTPVQGGFSTVRKVRIHESHISPNFLASGVSSILQPPTCLSNCVQHSWLTMFLQSKGTLFAVKTLRKSAENDRAFARERSALKRLGGLGAKDNTHVVKLLATFKHGDRYSFIFPWAESDLLTYWRSEPDERNPGATLRWLAGQCLGLAKGLQSIHNMDARHGDIKPQNILCFPGGIETVFGSPGVTLAIADFGLARWHNDKSRSTKPQKLYGTWTYSPPECAITDGCISDSWDIWSLGCLWLEFVTWYLLGSDRALEAFADARTQVSHLGPGILDDCFFTVQEQEGTGSPIQYNLRPAVKNVSDKLEYFFTKRILATVLRC